MNKAHFLLLIFAFSFAPSLLAQKSKSQLEEEKRENLKKIVQAEKILTETESEKKVTIGQLSALKEQIKARESLIKSLTEEIKLLDGEISDLTVVVNALQSDLKNLKEEYAAMIYTTYKANEGYSMLMFLFSSETFNQLFQRLKYLRQYAEARKMQAQQIEEVSKELNGQKRVVLVKRNEQKKLLDDQLKESQKLESLRSKQNGIVQSLSQKEKELRIEVQKSKKAIEKLDKLIAEMVARELAMEKNKSETAKASSKNLNDLFEQNKNKLVWPVIEGFITMKFGVQPHPVIKNLTVENTGIDIQTKAGSTVVAVFDGEVAVRAFLPGHNNVVIVRHGNYFTTYSKLKDVRVSKGQQIKANEIIGTVQTDADGISEMHLEIWKNTQKLDPETWLSKR